MKNNDILSAEEIRKHLSDGSKYKILCFNEVASTNTLLKNYALDGEEDNTVLIAEKQTNGRGRMGRTFFSPSDTGLYMSILLRPRINAENSLYITTAAAAAAAVAIETVTSVPTLIKWVNDVFADRKKVCGILTEASLSPDEKRMNYAILGIGINIYPPQSGFPDDIRNIAGYITDTGNNLRAKIAAKFIDTFFEYYNALPDKIFMQEYINRSFIIGKTVSFTSANEKYSALVTGINDDFSLGLLLSNGTRRVVNSGEVTIGSGTVSEI